MRQSYESPCPRCGEMIDVADEDLMGFPMKEPGDEDPLTVYCEDCGLRLEVQWDATLTEATNECIQCGRIFTDDDSGDENLELCEPCRQQMLLTLPGIIEGMQKELKSLKELKKLEDKDNGSVQ